MPPLYYTDTFGEKNVINHYIKYPSDYIVILNITTVEYGSEYFCEYAKNFCEIIEKRYNLVFNENDIKIYKRK